MRPRMFGRRAPCSSKRACAMGGSVRACWKRACPNYLGVSSNRAIVTDVQSRHPALARHVTTAPWRRCVEMNNAQVVILSGFTAFYLWRYRTLRHAESVAWSADFNPITLLRDARLARFGPVSSADSAVPSLVTCRTADGRSRTAVRQPHPASEGHITWRRGITFRTRWASAGLFKKFEQLGVPYAVLRWFEGLPHEREGRDIDFMVADEKFDAVLTLLNSQPGIELADVYTPSGLPKSDYYGTPYYPTASAQQILTRTRVHNNFCRVPSDVDHFHSLAYHVIYHHGPRSGLKSRNANVRSEAKPTHDYEGVLRDAAARLGHQHRADARRRTRILGQRRLGAETRYAGPHGGPLHAQPVAENAGRQARRGRDRQEPHRVLHPAEGRRAWVCGSNHRDARNGRLEDRRDQDSSATRSRVTRPRTSVAARGTKASSPRRAARRR